MKLGPWTDSIPVEAGKYAKLSPHLQYPVIIDVVAFPDGRILEYSKEKFWEIRPGAKWAKVEEA